MMTAPVADPIDVAAAPSPQSVEPEATATPPASATPTPSPSDLPSIPGPQVEPNVDDVKASPSPPAQAPAQAPATTPTRAPAPAPVPSTAPPAVPAPSPDPQPEPEPEPPAPQETPPTVATWWDYGAHSFSAELNVVPGRSLSVIVDGSVLATTTTAGNRVTVSVQTPRSIYDLPVSFQYNDGAGESSGTMTGAEWIALAG